MPHKHRRDKSSNKDSHELPPTKVAKPLSVAKSKASTRDPKASSKDKSPRVHKRKSRDKAFEDDTPKAFARLMRYQATGRHPNGLDDGIARTNKKRKAAALTGGEGEPPAEAIVAPQKDVPTILPGERMSEFAARVDAALPVSGLMAKNWKGADPAGLQPKRTKLERRMNKMQDTWREEDKRRREKREEMEEELLDQDLENGTSYRDAESRTQGLGKKKKKKGKGKGRDTAGSDVEEDEDDPWAQLNAAKADRQAGLHDVVQAPPQFTGIRREKFKVRNGAMVETDGVPRSAGSLRRREELGETRKSVVESYRKMMQGKRTVDGV